MCVCACVREPLSERGLLVSLDRSDMAVISMKALPLCRVIDSCSSPPWKKQIPSWILLILLLWITALPCDLMQSRIYILVEVDWGYKSMAHLPWPQSQGIDWRFQLPEQENARQDDGQQVLWDRASSTRWVEELEGLQMALRIDW